MSTNARSKSPSTESRKHERADQLLALAREGNAEALGDLWLEFGFRMEGITTNTSDEILQANAAIASDR